MTLEGHYLRGYGDRTEQVLRLSPIVLLPEAADEAQKWLDEHTDDGIIDRIGAVIDLVSGFASAYGVELLATVHWTARARLPRSPRIRKSSPALLASGIQLYAPFMAWKFSAIR
jgi:hypothetical protein